MPWQVTGGKVATISSSMGVSGSRLCIGEGSRGDIGCPAYAPSITTAGDLIVSGTVSATHFVGDGSGLTGVIGTGASTFASLTDVSYSVAALNILGPSSFTSASVGSQNTAIGSQALSGNTTGSFNIAVGTLALFSNLSGVSNIGIGNGAALSSLNASANTAVGTNALNSNVSGSYNTAAGYYYCVMGVDVHSKL